MERFKALKPEPFLDGHAARMDFPNGYTASVVRHSGSYGGPAGLYELAVMVNGSIVYDTPITDDVLGYLSEEEVDKILGQMLDLPQRNSDEQS